MRCPIAELGAHDVMDVLLSAAVTWKYTVATRAEFRDGSGAPFG